MLLTWQPAGAGPVTVTLTLNGGVALVEPELWQLIQGSGRSSYVRVELNSSGPAHAAWRPSPDPATGETHLLVYYHAMDPMHPQLNYGSELKVEDAAGHLLASRPGGANPERVQRQIGPNPSHWDNQFDSISIS